MEKEAGGTGLLLTPLQSAELKEKLRVSGGGTETQRRGRALAPGDSGLVADQPGARSELRGFLVEPWSKIYSGCLPPGEGGAKAAPHFGRKTTFSHSTFLRKKFGSGFVGKKHSDVGDF